MTILPSVQFRKAFPNMHLQKQTYTLANCDGSPLQGQQGLFSATVSSENSPAPVQTCVYMVSSVATPLFGHDLITALKLNFNTVKKLPPSSAYSEVHLDHIL